MSLRPKISVVIPCYNQGHYINEAVESVLSQTYQDFEIVIVNDGSTDNFTNELFSSFLNPKIKIITTKNNGVVSARNIGIKESKGEYILPLDSDDKIGKEYLEKAVEILDQNKGIGIVYCNAEFFGDKKGKWKLPEYSLEKMLLKNIIFCSALFRKKDWEKVGGYNSNMELGLEDWDFWLSLIEIGIKVFKIPEILFYYRIKKRSRNSLWKNMNSDQKLNIWLKIFDNHENLYQKNIRNILKHVDLDDARNSWSYKLGKLIRNPFSGLKKTIVWYKEKEEW